MPEFTLHLAEHHTIVAALTVAASLYDRSARTAGTAVRAQRLGAQAAEARRLADALQRACGITIKFPAAATSAQEVI